ncbi:MAG: glycosyltransferase family 4 protein, partial [Sphaerospermopsis kisseleviana]
LWEFPMPFVWGPVGGTQNVPLRFLPSLGFVDGARHAARNLVNEWQKRFHRRSKLAFRRAAAVIAVASDTREEVRRHHHVESRVIAAALCDAEQSGRRVRTPHQGPCRFVFSGLHVSRKGLPFALRALARLAPSIEWTLDVMGQGPLSASWRRLATRLGLGSRVTFHGHVPRTDLMNTLRRADVYVFPSLLEGWPAAIAEALSLGLPVVTTDHHGMRDMVTSRCGRLVPVRSPSQLIEDLSQAFRELACDPGLVQQLSQGALERATELGAEVQVPLILDVYAEAIARAGHGSHPIA